MAYLDKDPALGAVKPVTELGPVRWENERDLLQQQLATLVERQREFGESVNSNVTIYQEPDEDKNEDYRDFFERAEISGSCFAHSNRRYCYREYFQLHEGGGIGMRLLFLLGRNSEPARILASEGILGSGVPAAMQPWLIADIDRDGTEELILRSRPSENGGYFVHFSSMETSVRVVSSEDPADLIPGSVFAYQVIPASILTDP